MARRRRIDIKGVLADPDLRRKLMVSTIQATQAREGIETTKEQADRAYYVVTEGERTAFFRLSQFQNREKGNYGRSDAFVRELRGEGEGIRLDLARTDFKYIEGSPIVYRSLVIVGPIFKSFTSLDPLYGRTRSGLNTTEISRFVRQRWEVTSGARKRWVLFAKGGDYSRFYTDWDLVFDWTDDGREFKALVGSKYGSPSRFVKSEEDYFTEGITWMQTTNLGINARRLPGAGIFGVASPTLFLTDQSNSDLALGIMNSSIFDMLARCVARRNWGATAIGSLPVPAPNASARKETSLFVANVYRAKAQWDSGNEISTRYTVPWLLREDIIDSSALIADRLGQLISFEASEDISIQKLYRDLNAAVYRLYGISDRTQKVIEETLGDRPPEIIWPQMEGKGIEQKRMEHIWRLLSYVVKRIVEADEDGIVPFQAVSGKAALMDRVYRALESLFPKHSISQVEVEIVNELKRKVKGYRAVNSIREWLEDVYFQYHVSLYKNRPIFWHIASRQGKSPAFSAFVHYHRFDKNAMAVLRGTYLREAMAGFRREAAMASKEGREGDRVEWQSKLEETTELDRKLQMVQEGHHEGSERGDRDYRILTPWKTSEDRAKGWDPDIDDGVKVNIEPLQKAGVLRIGKVI